MKKPNARDFFKQFDIDVEIHEVSAKEANGIRKMSVFDHDEFVHTLETTFDRIALDAVSVLYHDIMESPNSKTHLNLLIRLITRIIGIKHVLDNLTKVGDKILDPPGFDYDEIRVELIQRIQELREQEE